MSAGRHSMANFSTVPEARRKSLNQWRFGRPPPLAAWVGYSGTIMSSSGIAEALDPIRFTLALCQIESTTYNEGAVGDFLAGFLADRGWAVEKTPVSQPTESATAAERWNVYAGTAGETPDLVFSTHMDTVPPYIAPTEDAEFLYGRGVSDAKGIIAAQVAAAEALRAQGFRIGVAVCLRRRARLGGRQGGQSQRPRATAFSSTASQRIIVWRWRRRARCAPSSSPAGRWRIRPILN